MLTDKDLEEFRDKMYDIMKESIGYFSNTQNPDRMKKSTDAFNLFSNKMLALYKAYMDKSFEQFKPGFLQPSESFTIPSYNWWENTTASPGTARFSVPIPPPKSDHARIEELELRLGKIESWMNLGKQYTKGGNWFDVNVDLSKED